MAENFDLLGDPIPEGLGKRGRPPHLVTEKNRCKVIMLLAMCWDEKRIAGVLGISEPTLRKHYFRELASRAVALDRMRASHLALLWTQAEAGNVAAMKEIGRELDKIEARVFGVRASADDAEDGDEAPRVPSRPLGKKEEARLAAAQAGVGTEWGDDLLPGMAGLPN